MKKYDIALFDLDGTLSESGEGILDCVRMIFRDMNRPLPDESSLAAFIGPPMYDSLRRCGFDHEDAQKGVAIYKSHFISHGIYKNKVYDGIPELLRKLRDNGVRLGVASTKYQKFTDRIIGMLGLTEYFDIVGGCNAVNGEAEGGGSLRSTKIDVMNYVIDNMKKSDAEKAVMIGDTKYDAEGACAVGCDFIGCRFGYGSEEEMISNYPCGAPVFVDSPAEIAGYII